MATHTTSHLTPLPVSRRLHPARALPLVLRANAATSVAAGLVGLIDARWAASRLGLADTTWVRLIGAGLVLFGMAVAAGSRSHGPRLARAAALTSVADGAWVAGTIVLLGLALAADTGLSGTGSVIAAVMGVGVADFGLAQLWLARRLSPGHGTAES